MEKDIVKMLNDKVRKFRKWAEKNYPDKTEDNDNGQWCFCSEFDEMYSAAVDVIEKCPASEADESVTDDLLYAIARDNECECIIQIAEKHNEWFSLLCRKCLDSPYTNAKWQFAKELGKYDGDDDLKQLIYRFLSTGDEYTERMALQSLADIDPKQAEKYAVRSWERNIYKHDEYQKIMALHVLYRIKSPLLEKYLREADISDYHYLRENAAQIREMLAEDNVDIPSQ